MLGMLKGVVAWGFRAPQDPGTLCVVGHFTRDLEVVGFGLLSFRTSKGGVAWAWVGTDSEP